VEAVILLLAGVVLGGVVSWAITRHYYRQALADTREAAIAQRLDDCNEGDKTFLVALLQAERPIPRYALVNVEFVTLDGRTGSWESNTSTMARSVNSRARHSLQTHGGDNIDEDRQTITLTERGRENAEYIVRREYHTASFTNIDDSDPHRLAIFKHEHKREPSSLSERGGWPA